MNCKQGDLAVYVGLVPEVLGTIVQVVGLKLICDVGHMGGAGPAWFVDPPIKHSGQLWVSVLDSALRPIRDNDGADETLAWAGKPEKVAA
jgi:hypothetical protein